MPINLSIVVPLFNEEESVAKLIDALLSTLENMDRTFEIILIDDGSTDDTWKIIEQLKNRATELRAIKFRRNYGQTSAMVAGFDHAKGEIIVTIDGDLQNDPSDIPLLIEKIEEGYDIVSGWRKYRKDHFSRVFPSKIANGIISLTTGVKLHDYGCSLKAYRTDCIRMIQAYGEMHRFFPALASMTGARVLEVPVQHHPRRMGVSKYGFSRIFKVFSDIFAINMIIRFSSKPLKGFALASTPFFLLTAFFAMLSFFSLHFQWTAGKFLIFAIASALFLMASVHLITLGVLSELVVGTSDLTHTQFSELSKKTVDITSRQSKNKDK